MALLRDNAMFKVAVWSVFVALAAEVFRHVEDYGDGKDVMLFGQCYEGFAGAFLYAGGVDNGEFVVGEAFGGHVVEGFKCLFCDGLVGFVVADESAEVVGGEDFGRFEVGFGKCGFARARRAYEDDEGDFGECDVHDLFFIKYGHLRWRAYFWIYGADGFDCCVVVEFFFDALCPILKLFARPLKAVVGVAKLPGGKRCPAHVEVGIWGGDDDGVGLGIFKYDAFENGQSRWVEVFNNF